MLEFMNDRAMIEDSHDSNREKADNKDFKLPKIQRVTSRGQPKDIRHAAKLPSLRFQTMSQKSQDNTDRKMPEDEDLVGNVQKKLRLIMQEQNMIQIGESDQEDDNFQRKINENKEMIKKVKRRNQEIKKQNEHFNNNLRFNQNMMKKFSHKNRNEHFQKRHRQYKEPTLQNKLGQKRKELSSINKNHLKEVNRNLIDHSKEYVSNKEIVLKEFLKENQLKEIKSKDQLVHFNKILPNHSQKPTTTSVENKKFSKQFSQKNLSNGHKNELLFDVIHNYLQNPKKNESQVMNLGGSGKEKTQLQEKLKEYELKLQNLNNQCSLNLLKKQAAEQSEKDKENGIKFSGSNHWQTIRINERCLFDHQNSNFEKQIERINKYASKNQKSLQKYVENQQLLYEMQMVCRTKGKGSCSAEKESI